jgi:hypothetical protein
MRESPIGIDQLRIRTEETLEQQHNKKLELSRIYNLCFSTDAGKIVLAMMQADIDEQETFDPNMSAQHGYYREGMKAVLRKILSNIKYSTQKQE